jgi:hypothetical protein
MTIIDENRVRGKPTGGLTVKINLPPSMACLLIPAVILAGGVAFAQVEVTPPSINFGERGQNERPEETVIIRNKGARPVQIQEIKKSCDCLTISPAQIGAPIPAGGTFPIRISMGSGRAMGRLDKYVTIVTSEPGKHVLTGPGGRVGPEVKIPGVSPDPLKGEVKIPISMRVFDDFEMEPRELRFAGAIGGPPETGSVEVKLRKGRPPMPIDLKVVEVKSRFNRPSDRHLKAAVEESGGAKKIVVTLDSAHPEGPISAEVEAKLNGKSLFIPVIGDMFAWIKVVPNYVNFSRAQESDSSSTVREVVLSSTDGTPFKVLGIAWKPAREGEKTVRLEFSAAPGETPATVQKIACKALRGEAAEMGGSFFGTVTIRTDHPKKPEIALKYSGFFVALTGKK